MSRVLGRRVAAVREALLEGDANRALHAMDDLIAAVARDGVPAAAREQVDGALVELRDLAEASLSGAQLAAQQVRAIVHAARSLHTYDQAGRKQVTQVGRPVPRRY